MSRSTTAFAVRSLVVVLALASIDLYESALALASQVDPALELPQHVADASRWAVGGVAFTVVLALLGSSFYSAVRYLRRAPAASVGPEPQPLTQLVVPMDPSWIKSGTPRVSQNVTRESSDGSFLAGIWQVEGPTVFEWRYGVDETIHLLEGAVELEYLNRKFVLNPGDTVTFLAGTRALWNVPVKVKKVFTLQKPGLLVRLWRAGLRLV